MNTSNVVDFTDMDGVMVIDDQELVIDGRRQSAGMNDLVTVKMGDKP